MRGSQVVVAALLVVAAAGWAVRPAALGDAGGLWAFTDRTFPAAAALRAQYLPENGQPAAASAAKADKGAKGGGKAGPAVVVTQSAEIRTLPLTFEGIGTVQAVASIAIRPRIDSQITDVAIAEGAAVKAGDLLFRLDDRALKAQLAQAEAQTVKDQALLDGAKRDLARADELVKQKFAAPVTRDAAATQVSQWKAQLGVDAAQKQGIVTSLTYTEIRSPLTGRIGSIAAKTGATVRSGDSLATVNQIDPIYISFALPQARLGELRAAMAARIADVRVKADASSPVGSIAFIENAVDSATNTVQVRAKMPNPAEKLWPGAFQAVEVVLGVDAQALVVPSAAVLIGQNGAFVFVVSDGHATLRQVTVARSTAELAVISAGLATGDDVVVKGQMALTDGAEVKSPGSDKTKTSSAKPASDG